MGYHIGMEACYRSASKIIFATNGIFLNYLVHDPKRLGEYSHVILDEVHERDLDMDFILILLRCLAPEFPELKIILMSATLDSSSLAGYFSPDKLTLDYISGFKERVRAQLESLRATRLKTERLRSAESRLKACPFKVESEVLPKHDRFDYWDGGQMRRLIDRHEQPMAPQPHQEAGVGRRA